MIAIRGKAFWAWVVIITVLVLIASARQKSIEAAETKGVQSNTTATGPKPQNGKVRHDPN